jgi:hypothetical protein
LDEFVDDASVPRPQPPPRAEGGKADSLNALVNQVAREMRVSQYHLTEVVERVLMILGPQFEERVAERVLAAMGPLIEQRLRKVLEEVKEPQQRGKDNSAPQA